ncbi:hypothetical protein KBZ21_27405 [Streptomyces sp. A73]|nr:hypothetical protein [Streptomyces sp. A73]
MPIDNGTGPPIYNSLIEEHGDVPGDVRQAAEELQQEAEQAVDFSPVHHRHPSTGRPESSEPPAPGPAPEQSRPPQAPGSRPAQPGLQQGRPQAPQQQHGRPQALQQTGQQVAQQPPQQTGQQAPRPPQQGGAQAPERHHDYADAAE